MAINITNIVDAINAKNTNADSNTSDTETNANVYLIKDVTIPAGSSLEVLSGSKVVLQTTDLIRVDCDVSAKIDASLSIMEIT